MRTVLALLSVWIKAQFRQPSRRAKWWRLVGGPWLATSLAASAALSAYWSIQFLGRWEGVPGMIYYLDWYLLLAWGFLSWASAVHLAQLLFPRPESLFLHASPASHRELYAARLSYSLLFNFVSFLAISLPPLVIIGLRGGEGWIYFASLTAIAVWISLAAALVGALLAVPLAFFVRFLPWRWQDLVLRLESVMVATAAYLVITCLLPLLIPPVALPRWWSFATPFVEGMVSWINFVPLAGGMAGLAGVSLIVYDHIFRIAPFEPVFPPQAHVSLPVRFSSYPLLRRELAGGWWGDIMVGTVGGVGLGLLEWRRPGPPPVVGTMLFFSAIPIFLVMLFGNTATNGAFSGTGFFLVRSSPTPLFAAVMRKFVSSLLHTALAGVIGVGVFSAMLGTLHRPWSGALLTLPVIIPCLLVPLVAVALVLELIHFRPRQEPSLVESYVKAVCYFLAVFGMTGAVGYFLYPLPRWFPGPTLAWRSAAFFAASLAVVYLLMRLVAARLERIEWK